jgi:HlyD family secretion protein
MKKPIAVLLIAAVLVGGIAGVWVWRRHVAASAQPRFETVTVDRGPIVAKVTATGTLSALVTVQVGTQV